MKAFRSNKFDITPSKQIIKEGTNSYFNWKQQLEPLLSAIPNQCEI
jgi:S-formylglutathione hydrolase FrmB